MYRQSGQMDNIWQPIDRRPVLRSRGRRWNKIRIVTKEKESSCRGNQDVAITYSQRDRFCQDSLHFLSVFVRVSCFRSTRGRSLQCFSLCRASAFYSVCVSLFTDFLSSLFLRQFVFYLWSRIEFRTRLVSRIHLKLATFSFSKGIYEQMACCTIETWTILIRLVHQKEGKLYIEIRNCQ